MAMINERFAKQLFPAQNPIGKRFIFGHPSTDRAAKWLTIVGVVTDTRLYGLANLSRLAVYTPFQQNPQSAMDVVVKTRVSDRGAAI